MKTRYAILSALLAAAIACGGGVDQKNAEPKQKVLIETSSALVIGDVATVEIVASQGGTAVYSGTLTYDPTKGTYKGAFYVAPGTYDLTLTARKADTTVIGTATSVGVVVSASAVTNVVLNVASVTDPLPTEGFVISGFTYTGYADVGAAAAFSVSTAQTGAAPTFAWTAKVTGSATNCTGSFAPSATAASVTWTGTVAQVCTVTVTATDAVNTNIKATRSATLGVGVNTSVTGTFIPSPTITKVELIGNGGYDGNWDSGKSDGHGGFIYSPTRPFTFPTCTALRSGTSGTAPNIIYANQTCPGNYKINSGIVLPLPTWDGTLPAPAITLSAPLFTIGVTYDLGGIYSATNPPKVGVTASCPNAATNGVSTYSFDNLPVANPIAGSGPGTATCPAAPAVCTGSAALYWTLPAAFNAVVGDLCTLTVTVNNQGSIDTFPVKLWIYE